MEIIMIVTLVEDICNSNDLVDIEQVSMYN